MIETPAQIAVLYKWLDILSKIASLLYTVQGPMSTKP